VHKNLHNPGSNFDQSITTLKLYFKFYNLRNRKVQAFHQFSKSKEKNTESVTRRRESLPKPVQQQRKALQRGKRLSLGGFSN